MRAGGRICALLACSLAACAPASVVSAGGYCAPPTQATVALAEDAPPPAGASREDRLAALLGLRGALLERRASNQASVESRLRVLERLELARLQIAATSAELDCEAQRAGQAADYLARLATSETQGLTVASIAFAAATAIAGVFLSTRNAPEGAQDGVAIGGGVVTAGLGLVSLYVKPRLEFDHARNLLADLRDGPVTSTTYPPLVWAYFTRADFSNEQRRPIRERLVERWQRFQRLREDASVEALLFGRGGAYDVDALRMRAAMLHAVSAEVELASQELEALGGALIGAVAR